MKKLSNKLWGITCDVIGYVMALMIFAFAILLPLTGITGMVWLMLKMLGVI